MREMKRLAPHLAYYAIVLLLLVSLFILAKLNKIIR